MQNQNKKLLTIIYTSLAIALVALSTLSIRIPAIKGYVNFGDIMIFVSAIMLGKRSGFLAGAIGSALADVLAAYFIFAPGTFIIKGLEGLFCALLIKRNVDNKPVLYSVVLATIVSGMWMVLGYFIYESFIFGTATAAASVPGNLLQGGVSAIAAIPIVIALCKTKLLTNINN